VVLGAWASAGAAEKCPAKPSGFVSLFDGKTLAGWHALPGGKWEVRLWTCIANQEEHHRLTTYREGLETMLQKAGIEYGAQYIA